MASASERFNVRRSNSTCSKAVGIRDAPGIPIAKSGLPAWRTIIGAIVLRERLPGAMKLMLFGSVNEKLLIESFITTPVPGGTTPAPKCRLCDWVAQTMLPWLSATMKCVVAAAGLS